MPSAFNFGPLGAYTPNLLGALAVLVIGWLVAFIIASAVRKMLHRTTLDNRLVEWLAGTRDKPIDAERWIAKGVYYVLMLFVLVGFFQVLGLAAISDPLNNLLTQILQALPRLVGAAILLLVAWIVASLLKMVVYRALTAAKVEERLEEPLEGQRPTSLAATVADAVYWLVFLFFLPGVLDALALQGLLTPVQGLVDSLLGFLPNLFGAGLILVFGWFAARIVRNIVTNLLAAVGTDRLSKDVGLTGALGGQPLSALVGLVVYILILIPVVIGALNALNLNAITQPASAMLATILRAFPAIFAAALLLLIAYIVGRLVAGLTTDLLSRAGFDNIPGRLGLATAASSGGRTPSELAGYLALVVILLFATIEAAELLGFNQVAQLITNFAGFLGQVVLGLAIFAVGLYLANLAAAQIRSSGSTQAHLLATVARVSILVLTASMALRQMGLANEIITLAFGLLLGAVAVAAAVAFGLGGQEVARQFIEDWRRSAQGHAHDGSKGSNDGGSPPNVPVP